MVLEHDSCEPGRLRSLRDVVIGGSPIPRSLLSRAREVFGDVFFPFYGMAETYSCGSVLRREQQFTEGTEAQVRRLTSAGKPMALIDLRVVDEEGRDVPHDNETTGEIRMAGPSVSTEYFRKPEDTATTFDSGWIKTGDVAVVDEEGFVTIVDRTKDIIITGGINVYSRDVEEALHSHPAVATVAVIGIPDERWGEAIHAVVVRAEGSEDVSADALLAFAAERLAGYKKPRSLEFMDELPVSATGKVLKRELRDRHRAPASLTDR
jgi:long-chain acyl-CoA synthetase